MIKCFLSHSSRDKESYVRFVAKKMRKEVKIFDEETFEEGMSPIEEIAHGLDASSLFVVFISKSALESKWVQDELANAKLRLDTAQLERIYPIIIEPGIRHDDPRIPEWMRSDLNIQPILKPMVAARKINARLMEMSWKFHPRLKERKEIFVGRNDLIRQFEERLDNFSQEPPIAIIASGLPAIGRKSLIQEALRKSNIIRESYEFPVISLAPLDGIEDLILKALDFEMVTVSNSKSRISGTFNEKIELAKEIFLQIANEGERLLIEDRGVIIQGNGEIVDWFTEILSDHSFKSHLTFCIASQFRPNTSLNRTNPLTFSVAVKEMDESERSGLLLRYSRFHELRLKRDDYQFFSDILTGYPEQVLFAVDLIRENGLFEAKKQSHIIQQYGSDKAKVVLEAYQEKPKELEFIYFLCRFEFLSYEVLFDIVDETTYSPILNSLFSSAICERMGSASDYIRVNEVIRDYVSRNRFGLPLEFEKSIKTHVEKFLERYEDDNLDISDYLFSAQESLQSGNGIPDELIIPSVFIKTIKRTYDEDRNYDEAIALADRVLQREKYLHSNTINHIRYIKCQSLARLRDGRFFSEAKKIPEPDRSFLHGFYYRLSGDYAKAEDNFTKLLSKGRRSDPRVIGELVLVYMQSDEYELAFDYAKENYKNRSGNPINANNYFTCLIMKERTKENRIELERIIEKLAIDPSDRAQEMLESMRARIIAYYDENEERSLALIEETIQKFPKINYPILTKADLATHFKNKIRLQEAVESLEKITGRHAQTYRTLIKYKAILLAMQGDTHQAKQLVKRELSGLIDAALQRLNDRLDSFAGR
jgi:tetratricopeptide (TPR) repeat protein